MGNDSKNPSQPERVAWVLKIPREAFFGEDTPRLINAMAEVVGGNLLVMIDEWDLRRVGIEQLVEMKAGIDAAIAELAEPASQGP